MELTRRQLVLDCENIERDVLHLLLPFSCAGDDVLGEDVTGQLRLIRHQFEKAQRALRSTVRALNSNGEVSPIAYKSYSSS